ncbi:MAG TPA: hypothetical protein H9752_03565 [Candidatus Phocaeicola excrementigallinarum]|nr:hypothetical protein [Candidatus Phocaeicola excrementigallinarum]
MIRACQPTNGNHSLTALLLDIGRTTLYGKMK